MDYEIIKDSSQRLPWKKHENKGCGSYVLIGCGYTLVVVVIVEMYLVIMLTLRALHNSNSCQVDIVFNCVIILKWITITQRGFLCDLYSGDTHQKFDICDPI